MFSYQVGIMIALCLLCMNKVSFWGAFILLISYCFYYLLVVPLPDDYYYSCSALTVFLVGLVLQKYYVVAAICSYVLVPVNAVGFLLYDNNYEPTLYDNVCLVILIIQLISLLPKGLLNGLGRNKYFMVNHPFFNGY